MKKNDSNFFNFNPFAPTSLIDFFLRLFVVKSVTSLVTLILDVRSRDQDEVTRRYFIYHQPKFELNPSSGLGGGR